VKPIKYNKEIEKAKKRIILNVKGSKKKPDDWISIAESVAFLKKCSFTIKEIAQMAGVSEQTIRQILKLNDLTEENKKRVLEGKILMDAAYRLAGIKNRKLQNMVGQIIENMKSHDQREIILYAKRYPNSSLESLLDFKKGLLNSKSIVKEINIVILVLENELYDKLKELAEKEGVNLSELIINILEDKIERIKKEEN